MGSGGGLFDANDTIGAARLNQKTCTVDTAANLSALATTYAGQLVYATSTNGTFTIEGLYERNAANAAWILVRQFDGNTLTEVAEAASSPVADNADFTMIANTKYYAFFTLPTTEKIYYITGIEWKNGGSISGGAINTGVDVINANPPTIDATPVAATGQRTTVSGAINTVQRVSLIASSLIKGGTICGVWVLWNGFVAAPVIREQTGLGSQNQFKSGSETGTLINKITWSTATARKYIKVYYVGY